MLPGEDIVSNSITWSQIEAECGDYRAGFVATFRKYEGQPTDEKDAQGRTVKVTAESFARHVGIPPTTFQGWVKATTYVATPERQAQRDITLARSNVRRLPPAERAALASELLNEPEVVQRVVRDDTARASVRKALDDRYDEAPKPYPSQPDVPGAKPVELAWELLQVHKRMAHVLDLVADPRSVVTDDARDSVLAETRWLRNAVDLIESAVVSDSSLADQAAAFLAEETR